jgi:hypothetical protein
MDAYYLEVRKLENEFYGLEFHHVVHYNNVVADVLSKYHPDSSPQASRAINPRVGASDHWPYATTVWSGGHGD